MFGIGAFVLAAALSSGGMERGTLVENVVSRVDPAQSCTVYLPSRYDAAKSWPLLLILDPRGRSAQAAAIFQAVAEERGWILVSSNQSRSDTEDDRNTPVMRALIPEAFERFTIDPRRVYLAGFSGTAMYSWAFATRSGKIAGVIGVGGRLVEMIDPAQFSFAHYGFSGDLDFNNREMRAIEATLTAGGKVEHRFQHFEGQHEWIDAALARDAVIWMDVVAMKQKLVPRDDAFLARALEEDIAAAARLEPARKLEALRRYRAIARTYEGLLPAESAKNAVARLTADAAVAAEEKDEATWDRFEEQHVAQVFREISRTLNAMRDGDVAPTPARLARELRVADLKRRSTRPGAEGRAAARLLESTYSQTGFYLMRSLFARRDYSMAVVVLGVAADIHPDRWPVHYNIGAAQARLGNRKAAFAALEKATKLGFHDPAQLEGDEDYASLREDARFKAIVAGMGGSPRD